MARYKTFDSTGLPTSGRLYSGDLNGIQDFLAKATDFTQTVDLGTLRVGDSSIALTKYGTAEATLSSRLRVNTVIRAGVHDHIFMDTTARDALAATDKPKGAVIFNLTVGKLQVNTGSGASPVWETVTST